jgi:hypothetical protein
VGTFEAKLRMMNHAGIRSVRTAASALQRLRRRVYGRLDVFSPLLGDRWPTARILHSGRLRGRLLPGHCHVRSCPTERPNTTPST